MSTLLFWVGGLEALSLATLIATVIVQWRTATRVRPYAELVTSIHQLSIQQNDLADHIERKETRERVRRLRDNREAAHAAKVEPGDAPAVGTPEYKQWLRRKMRSVRSAP